jgi:pyruvate,water dikinase
MVMKASLPRLLAEDIAYNYNLLSKKAGRTPDVAVRSSATAEDLPTASFAGMHESFLNVNGADAVLIAVKKCYASLFQARAIKYRIDNGFDHRKVALSAGIQLMVRADLASSGVCFTIEPDSGFRNAIVLTSCWGLGENIVQGTVVPDEFHLFKPFVGKVKNPIISKKIGSKLKTMVYSDSGVVNLDTSAEKAAQITLTDKEVVQLAHWALLIEVHYKMPMDIEWAKDGLTGELFILQARPETVHSTLNPMLVKEFRLKQKGEILVIGSAIGTGISTGVARLIESAKDSYKLNSREVLVTDLTNPDWDPIMKKAAAIITNKGGRTSHAAIIAREMGTVAIVGASGATEKIREGEQITIDTSQGKKGVVYKGKLVWETLEHDFSKVQLPQTKAMLILADPDKAYKYSFYPSSGVGLLRMEFIINNAIKIHPMALVNYDKLEDPEAKGKIDELTSNYTDRKNYFIDKLSQGIGTIAAAFYPREVIVRMSDFKSNEYSNLLGGRQFELEEENPMIGFRGASRYYNDRYREGFKLECEAIKVVREEMGFTNVKLMIPFCRTVEEGKKVIELMKSYGLSQGEKGLEIYVMAEIPSNVILAKEFAEVFDGFSIGSNDLTQLTLGIDRDSTIISSLFDENNPAVKQMIAQVISAAKASGAKIGLCGQAPSDDASFAAFLIEQQIDSISFNPDALLGGITNMNKAEK